MLNSLEIKNFRNFKDFKIKSLGNINLIIGKNNTGKSTLLEAIALYASKGDPYFLYQLLLSRGEIYQQQDTSKDFSKINLKAFSSFFPDRESGYTKNDAFSIGPLTRTAFDANASNETKLSIRIVKFYDDDQGLIRKRIIIEPNDDDSQLDYKIGLEINLNDTSHISPLDKARPYLTTKWVGSDRNFQFIRTGNIDREINGTLWDSIALTSKEDFVITALRIIEPGVEGITFIDTGMDSPPRERSAVVKLKTNSTPFPLKSMGDGINRILTIVLALVNAENGYLLIDEFENGLHYSVQEKLWEIIFNLSAKLNIQVFATTHSEDCISGFESILNSTSSQDLRGKLIRLDIVKGIVKQVEYDAEELKIATNSNIETR